MSTKFNKKSLKFLLILFFSIFILTVVFKVYVNRKYKSSIDGSIALRSYSLEDIKPFDGTDDNKPIYIGMNGFVYDVSEGREFYKVDGPYHYLAGKDSSTELNMIGGGIVKRKYPVIGKLIN